MKNFCLIVCLAATVLPGCQSREAVLPSRSPASGSALTAPVKPSSTTSARQRAADMQMPAASMPERLNSETSLTESAAEKTQNEPKTRFNSYEQEKTLTSTSAPITRSVPDSMGPKWGIIDRPDTTPISIKPVRKRKRLFAVVHDFPSPDYCSVPADADPIPCLVANDVRPSLLIKGSIFSTPVSPAAISPLRTYFHLTRFPAETYVEFKVIEVIPLDASKRIACVQANYLVMPMTDSSEIAIPLASACLLPDGPVPPRVKTQMERMERGFGLGEKIGTALGGSTEVSSVSGLYGALLGLGWSLTEQQQAGITFIEDTLSRGTKVQVRLNDSVYFSFPKN